MGGGVDREDLTGGHLADEQSPVLASLAEEYALRLAAQRHPVTDGEGVDVKRDELGGAGVQSAEPQVAAVEVIVVVVPGPGDQAVDVAGATDFLGEDVDGGDMRGTVAEDQDLAGVTLRRGFCARAAPGRAFRPALAAGGRQHGHAKAAHAGQQSSSRESLGGHRLGPFTAGSLPVRGHNRATLSPGASPKSRVGRIARRAPIFRACMRLNPRCSCREFTASESIAPTAIPTETDQRHLRGFENARRLASN